MSKTLDALVRSNGAFYVDSRYGSLLERVAGVNPTIVGTPKWGRTKKGLATICEKTGDHIYYPDAVSNRVTGAITIIALIEDRRQQGAGVDYYIPIAKRSAVACNYLFYYQKIAGGGSIVVYDGALVSSLVVAIPAGTRFLAVTISGAGVKPRFFVDGSFKGLGNNNQSITAQAVSVYTNGQYTDTYELYNPENLIAVLNTAASDLQIAQIYDELTKESHLAAPATRNFPYPYPLVPAEETRPLIEFDAGTPKNGANYPNRGSAGGTYDLAVTGQPVVVPGCFKHALGFTSTQVLSSLVSVTELNAATRVTIEAVFKTSNTVTGKYLFGWGVALNSLECYILNNVLYVVVGNTATTYGQVAFTSVNVEHHIRIEYDGSQATNPTRLAVYLDGAPQTLAFTGVIPAILAATNRQFRIASRYDGTTSPWDGTISYFRMWVSGSPSAAACLRHYQAFARLCRYRQTLEGVPVSLVNVTSGTIQGSDREVTSGTWAIGQDTTSPYKKWLRGIAVGGCVAPQKSAYGTWTWEFKFSAVYHLQMFIASTKLYNTAPNNGYLLYGNAGSFIFYREDNGANVGLLTLLAAGSLVANTNYKIVVTRSKAGAFTFYIKGGVYAVWTNLGSVADTTYSISNYWITQTTEYTRSMYVFEDVLVPTNADDGAFLDALQ